MQQFTLLEPIIFDPATTTTTTKQEKAVTNANDLYVWGIRNAKSKVKRHVFIVLEVNGLNAGVVSKSDNVRSSQFDFE